ncbi:hypothetical protein C8R45DRAFT_1082629 [Mycena sanguinolenta]|nr:hypothetical protein C8R45DRAFT_1082629 [Mycena sanguinolenta]
MCALCTPFRSRCALSVPLDASPPPSFPLASCLCRLRLVLSVGVGRRRFRISLNPRPAARRLVARACAAGAFGDVGRGAGGNGWVYCSSGVANEQGGERALRRLPHSFASPAATDYGLAPAPSLSSPLSPAILVYHPLAESFPFFDHLITLVLLSFPSYAASLAIGGHTRRPRHPPPPYCRYGIYFVLGTRKIIHVKIFRRGEEERAGGRSVRAECEEMKACGSAVQCELGRERERGAGWGKKVEREKESEHEGDASERRRGWARHSTSYEGRGEKHPRLRPRLLARHQSGSRNAFARRVVELAYPPRRFPLCRLVHKTLAAHLKGLVTLHFSSFGQGNLEQRMMILVQDYMQQRTDSPQALIAKLIQLEEDVPLTLNEHYLADYKVKFLGDYKRAREQAQHLALAAAIEAYRNNMDSLSFPTGITQVVAGLTLIGLGGINVDDLVKLLPSDRMDPALNIMADVGSPVLIYAVCMRILMYPCTPVAYKRIADNIPLAIDHELVRGVGRELLPTLYRGLGINGPDGVRICRELAQESPSVAGKHEELLKRLERLETASRELVTVGL